MSALLQISQVQSPYTSFLNLSIWINTVVYLVTHDMDIKYNSSILYNQVVKIFSENTQTTIAPYELRS